MKPYEVERVVRERLGEMYGTRFRRGKLIIGDKSRGEPQIHEFDLISEDRSIIGEVKSGRCSTTNYSLALVDCFYLSKVKSRMKLMVFTDKELHDYFREKSLGLISADVQSILISIAEIREATISE
jgi:hypothetical protein